jgi:hypothetical protein
MRTSSANAMTSPTASAYPYHGGRESGNVSGSRRHTSRTRASENERRRGRAVQGLEGTPWLAWSWSRPGCPAAWTWCPPRWTVRGRCLDAPRRRRDRMDDRRSQVGRNERCRR